ncbi:helix-turn-helix domain containing protein [Bacillus cereus]|uniref:helix-turn-helix domain containing protein n=1 Tax=Bacillus cereus TaxID=1396 RepID=UPI001879C48A|nr:helix-turn-helix domain containing protein [Bacillus cereus]MBE7099455.1 helix-turn-helix domain containing protein [Bacillus cereus]MBE7124042.1 helix-turn-helix domain containing protein [Bacillus cereus]
MATAYQHEAMKESRLKIHVVLEEANFLWDERDIVYFREMWQEGISFVNICKKLRRHQIEVMLLILDQADLCKIEKRHEGLGMLS